MVSSSDQPGRATFEVLLDILSAVPPLRPYVWIEVLMTASFLLEKEGPITTLTFNQPARRNFMNHEVMREMEELICSVRDDRETRVLITTGTGPAFSAGADLWRPPA